jgi:hypothetical protein
VHLGLNDDYGNVEVFKLDDGGVMYGIMKPTLKVKREALPLFLLVNCMKEGSIFGLFGVSRFYREMVICNM